MDKLAQYELEALNLKDKLQAEGRARVEVAAAFYTLMLEQAKALNQSLEGAKDEATGC